jgi:transcription termination/antitermination protein NusG
MDGPQNTNSEYDRISSWYAIQTYAGYERHVQQTLQQEIALFGQPELIDRAIIPIVDQEQFPGYVLVHMQLTEATWALVRATTGLTKDCQPRRYHGAAPN